MNYRIAVCDDDPVFLEETTNLILNYQFEKDMNLTLSPFKSTARFRAGFFYVITGLKFFLTL